MVRQTYWILYHYELFLKKSVVDRELWKEAVNVIAISCDSNGQADEEVKMQYST